MEGMTPTCADEGDDKYDFTIEGQQRPLIPPGIYAMSFCGWATMVMFKTPKLVMHWQIQGPGGVILPKYYPVKGLIGPPRINGRFVLTDGKDFVRDYMRLFGEQRRMDRYSMRAFNGITVLGKVETVINDHKGRPLAEPLQYSVVRELLEIVIADEPPPY